MVLLQQQNYEPQFFLLLQPKFWLQQPNVFVDGTKYFVVVTKYFCYPNFTNDFVGITKPFIPCLWPSEENRSTKAP